ncbi:MAG TPA: DUF4416 family protein [Planctomycetota bacterium]|nr:DUF4416 family protein [Planctomycetota bacterium]
MGDIRSPKPVKLLVGMLAQRPEWLDAAERLLAADFGPIDLASDLIPFDFTDYYAPEMGPRLLRKFVTHERLIRPGDIAAIKLRTNQLEAELARELAAPVPRPVNLDPGYLDGSKLVLATTKDYVHRIYLSGGIYAEITLTYRKGSYAPTPWTYRDYATPPYLAFFAKARARYLAQLKTASPICPTGPIRPMGHMGPMGPEGPSG